MIIDKGKLIALLVEKTGQPHKEVKLQLDELKNRIRQASESGDEFSIEGFGTFTGKNSVPAFEPAEQLKTEINQKYAGMKPIELMEAFKETGAGIPVEEVPKEPRAAPPEEELQKTTREPISESENEKEEPASEEMAPFASETDDQKPSEDTPEEEQEKVAPEPVAASAKVESSKPPAEPETKEEKEPDQPKRKYRKEPAFAGRESNKWGTVFLTAVVVIGIMAVGWGLYDSGLLGFEGGEGWQPQDSVAVTSVPPTSPSTGDTAAADGNATSMEQNAAENVSSNGGSGTYGLMGSVSEEGRNGFTIVLHSFQLQSTVQEIADSLDQQNYRTLILEGPASSSSRWRLGIGQFETLEAAQATVDTLPARIQSNYFITRIQ